MWVYPSIGGETPIGPARGCLVCITLPRVLQRQHVCNKFLLFPIRIPQSEGLHEGTLCRTEVNRFRYDFPTAFLQLRGSRKFQKQEKIQCSSNGENLLFASQFLLEGSRAYHDLLLARHQMPSSRKGPSICQGQEALHVQDTVSISSFRWRPEIRGCRGSYPYQA